MKKFLQRWLFSLGGVANNTMPNAPVILLLPIYNLGLGLSPAFLGIAMALPRIWEIFYDPWIGIVSDKTVTKMGRRRPYILAGSVFAGLFFILMWWVPTGWSKEAQGGWLIVTMMLYFTAFSTWYVPYAAFGIEVVRGNEPERLRLNGAINALGLFAGVPMGWLYWCCQRPIFHNPVEGMRYVGLIFGVLIGACALIPALIYREPPDLILQEETKPSAQVMKLGELLRIRPFQMLILCYFAMIFGFATVAQLGFYVVSYDGCRGDVRMGSYILGIASTVSGLLGGVAAPAIAASAGRFGRRQVLFPCLAIGTLGNLSLLWSITPSDIYLYVVSWIFTSFAIWGFWTIIPALLGSVSDDIERETGKACQGLISAVAGVSGKIAVSGSFMLTGVIMVVCGYDVKLTQAELVEPLLRMRLIYAVLPCLGLIIVAVAAWFCRVSTSAGEVVPAKPAA